MSKKLSTILITVGAAVFLFGSYISYQADQGREQISEAEQDLAGTRKPLVGPIRKNIKNRSAQNAQEAIREEEGKVISSEVTGNWLRYTGAAVFIVGLVCFFRLKRE